MIPARALPALFITVAQCVCIEKITKKPRDLTVDIIEGGFACQNRPVSPVAHAFPGHIVEGHAFIYDLVFIVHIEVGMDMPAHILVIFANDLIHG